MHVSETDIIRQVKGLALSFSSLADKKKITLTVNTNESSIIGFVDVDKLEKIITNLLSNAFKFTSEGGVVEISITPLSSASPLIHTGGIKGGADGYILINISNSGKGIPANQLNKIFDRFYQTNDNYKKYSEGS